MLMTLPDVAVGCLPTETLVLNIAEDAYRGHARFTVAVDGPQVGGIQTATASHAAKQTQAFAITGRFGFTRHVVALTFLNEIRGRSMNRKRSLYLVGAMLNGIELWDLSLTMRTNGTAYFWFRTL